MRDVRAYGFQTNLDGLSKAITTINQPLNLHRPSHLVRRSLAVAPRETAAPGVASPRTALSRDIGRAAVVPFAGAGCTGTTGAGTGTAATVVGYTTTETGAVGRLET